MYLRSALFTSNLVEFGECTDPIHIVLIICGGFSAQFGGDKRYLH